MFPTSANRILDAFLPLASALRRHRQNFSIAHSPRCYHGSLHAADSAQLSSIPRGILPSFLVLIACQHGDRRSVGQIAHAWPGDAGVGGPFGRRIRPRTFLPACAYRAFQRTARRSDRDYRHRHRDGRRWRSRSGLAGDAAWARAASAGSPASPAFPIGMLLGATVDIAGRLPWPAQEHSALSPAPPPRRSPTARSISTI